MVESEREATVERIVARLAAIVGADQILVGEDVSARFDGWPPVHPLRAACIVRPRTTDDVAAILSFAHAERINVVTHGGRTGLSNGAVAGPDDIVLSLERMVTLATDPIGGTIIVEAGATLQHVQEAAAAAGLFYPVDLGARGSATIGGTIATNAGGNSVLRYGMTREQVLGLEVVLADGTVLSSLNRLQKNNAGYDLKQMFIGSEGTLGVVTRAVLRLQPNPGPAATAFLGFSSFSHGLDLLRRFATQGDGALTSFEVMWSDFYDLVLARGHHVAPLEKSHGFYALVEFRGLDAASRLEDAVAAAWTDGLVEDAVIAQSGQQAAAMWSVREDVNTALDALKPALAYDIGIPQAAMDSYVRDLREAVGRRWPEGQLVAFGHIGDGNLHLTIGVGSDSASTHQAVNEMVYRPLAPLGGSITAEHGVGLEKVAFLDVSRTSAEIALMRRLKRMLDPHAILNPGKVLEKVDQ